MFLSLLLITFIIAAAVSVLISKLFEKPITRILERIISDDIGIAWVTYLKFAIIVVGISGGVRIWQLEQYIAPGRENIVPPALNLDRWTLEIYRTIIGSLQSLAWLLLVFFLVALIAYVIVRGQEMKRQRQNEAGS
ncbi:MAG: hypothetical protein WAN36_16720 [Calditrichia bacterium]